MNKVSGYRNMICMRQKDMSEHLGISLQSYCNKENGKYEFKDTEKVKFVEKVNVLFPDVSVQDIFF